MIVFSRIWHAALALVIAASLVVQIGLLLIHGTDVTTGAENELVSVGTRLVRLFSYFTIQSNLFVLYVALTLLVNPNRDGPVWRVLRLDALLSISPTAPFPAGIRIRFSTLRSSVMHSRFATSGRSCSSQWWQRSHSSYSIS